MLYCVSLCVVDMMERSPARDRGMIYPSEYLYQYTFVCKSSSTVHLSHAIVSPPELVLGNFVGGLRRGRAGRFHR